MPFDLSVDDESALFDELRAQDARLATYRAQAVAQPQLAAALTTVHSAAPGALPGVKLAIAQAVAAGLVTTQQAVEAAVLAGAHQPSWTERLARDLQPWTASKGLVRTGLGVLGSGAQLVASVGSTVAGGFASAADPGQVSNLGRGAGAMDVTPPPNPDATLANLAKSTTLGQDISHLVQYGTIESGSGFFPGGTEERQRTEAARAYRGTVPGTEQIDPATGRLIPGTGQTATIGRVLASELVEPGSTGYRVISGLADAGIAWYADPANYAIRGLTAARETRNLLTAAKGLTDADIARVLRPGEKLIEHKNFGEGVWRTVGTRMTKTGKEANVREFVPYASIAADARTARASEAGAIPSYRRTFSPRQAEAWLQSGDGQRLVNYLSADRDWLSIHNAFGKNLEPSIVSRLQDAKDPDAVREVLYDVLGTSIRSVGDIRSVRSAPVGARSLMARQRFTQKLPDSFFSTGYKMPVAQKIETINNLDAHLANAKVPWATRSKIVGDYARGMETNAQDRYGALGNALKAIEDTMVEGYGVRRDIAHSLTSFSDVEAVRHYGVDQLGNPTDWAIARHAEGGFELDDELTSVMRATGPHLLSEGLSDAVELPDPRQIRRLTSNLRILTSTKEGKIRMPVAVLEHFQTSLLKLPAIIRPAFWLRVIGEEQFRMAGAGLSSSVRHPADWVQFAMHNSGSYDALGQDIVALSKYASDAHAWDEFSASLHRGLVGRLGAKNYTELPEVKSFMTGSWSVVDKEVHARQWERGLGQDELRQLYRDPTASRIAQGQTNDEIVAWFHSKAGERDLGELVARGDSGMPGINTTTGKRVKVARNFRSDVELSDYIDSVRRRVDVKVGQNADLLGAIAHGHIGAAEETVANTDLIKIAAGPRREGDAFGPASTWIGTRVRLRDGRVGVVVNDASEAGHSIVQVGARAWDDTGKMSKELRAAVKEWRMADGSPQKVKYAIRTNERVPGYRGEAAERTTEMKTRVVNGFFSGLYGRSSDYLSRSPAFRQFYWQRATELADNLAPAEANLFLKTMGEAAERHEGGSVAKLLGGEKAVGKAIDKAKAADGTITLNELDSYAKGWALDQTNKLLYSASRRGQFFDISRVIFPFGEAWKEVLQSWARIVVQNPRVVRRGQLVIQGARDYDPDGNGQGWFHTDPTSGQEVYTFPFSSPISRFITGSNPVTRVASRIPGVRGVIGAGPVGIDEPLQGSVQGLNIGLSPMPSIGWVGQIAVSKLVHDKPGLDFIKSILLPYGEVSANIKLIQPPWLQKVSGGLADSPTTARIYGDTYMRVVQFLAASGEYGSSTDEQLRLQRDATTQARALTVFRGLAQATGPSSPSVDFKVATTKGDMMAGALIQEYVRIRDENPDGALEEFLKLYGKDAMAYAVSRTRSVNGGLDASKAFGDWERDHGSLFDSFPDIAGYFADVGTDFDFAVYDRQLASGKREKLSGPEYLSLVNETIVNARYYGARDDLLAQNQAAGRQSLTTAQRSWLSDLKGKLFEQYPVSHPSQHPASTDELRHLTEAANDKRLADNPIAQATRKYLALRGAALAEADRRKIALSNPAAADLRDWLAQAGAKLTERTPTFSRLWDRLLAQEVT